MTLLGFIVLLIIAAIAGALGQAISGYSLGGFLVSIVVGASRLVERRYARFRKFGSFV